MAKAEYDRKRRIARKTKVRIDADKGRLGIYLVQGLFESGRTIEDLAAHISQHPKSAKRRLISIDKIIGHKIIGHMDVWG